MSPKATARRAEAEAARTGKNENNPRAWLGIDATWKERRAFDWQYLACESERCGQLEIAKYAQMRADELRGPLS